MQFMHTIEAFSIYSNIPEAGAVNDQKHQEREEGGMGTSELKQHSQ